MEKYRTAAVRYFFIDTYFKVFWYSRTEQPMYFLKNVVKIFVLTNAALPADLGDGQFSLPDEFQSVLNTDSG